MLQFGRRLPMNRSKLLLRGTHPEATVDDDRHGAAWDFTAPGGPRLVPNRQACDDNAPDGLPLTGTYPTPSAFDLAATAVGDAAARPVGAPVGWLAAAAACLVGALASGWWRPGRPAFWLAGWLAGGFACVGLLAVFTLADSRRRTNPWYSASPMVLRCRTALVLLAAIAVCLNAWRFADWVSRR
jgi:hypothetical protein